MNRTEEDKAAHLAKVLRVFGYVLNVKISHTNYQLTVSDPRSGQSLTQDAPVEDFTVNLVQRMCRLLYVTPLT